MHDFDDVPLVVVTIPGKGRIGNLGPPPLFLSRLPRTLSVAKCERDPSLLELLLQLITRDLREFVSLVLLLPPEKRVRQSADVSLDIDIGIEVDVDVDEGDA